MDRSLSRSRSPSNPEGILVQKGKPSESIKPTDPANNGPSAQERKIVEDLPAMRTTPGSGVLGRTSSQEDDTIPLVQCVSLGNLCAVKVVLQHLGLGGAHMPFDWNRTSLAGLLHFLRYGFDRYFDYDTKKRVPGTTFLMYRSDLVSHWHDPIDEQPTRDKLMRRIRRFAALAGGDDPRPLLFIRVPTESAELGGMEELYAELKTKIGCFGRPVFLLVILENQEWAGLVLHKTNPFLFFYHVVVPPPPNNTANDEYPFSFLHQAVENALRLVRMRLGLHDHGSGNKVKVLCPAVLCPTELLENGTCREYGQGKVGGEPLFSAPRVGPTPRPSCPLVQLPMDEDAELQEEEDPPVLPSESRRRRRYVYVNVPAEEPGSVLGLGEAENSTEQVSTRAHDETYGVSSKGTEDGCSSSTKAAPASSVPPRTVTSPSPNYDRNEKIIIEDPSVPRSTSSGASSSATAADHSGDPPSDDLLMVFRERVLKPYPIHPKLWLIVDFVDAGEIAVLLKLAEGNWRPSATSKARGFNLEEEKFKDHGVSESRTSYSCLLKSDAAAPVEVKRLRARVAAVCKREVELVEPLSMVRYYHGQFFGEHHDGAFRSHTVFLYLNDVQSGGQTVFPALGLGVQPKAGMAVLWSNVDAGTGRADMDLVHRGDPPGEGETKYGVNCFVNQKIAL